ncbi:hypothetical protein I862_04280 [endosymbiont of Acanthamoeba sp. UWC8]|uniref:phage tail tube protein n=1 Tax=endosymbiont of Acanthamoeba sp. UWC8 TaxID=86106 RepID=UPI0004D15F2B|nr:phage tail tube protein [endosymbiont of Acanthamoeba sp. UWC8]AIF81416.1 hypothetical protein I862_04280 [endosymbiont of Acanthamoeba sp. UWC8]
MSRAYGWNAELLLGFETIYGKAPGSFHQVPFVSSSIDSEQGLIESNVLGLGRDPTSPFRDIINIDGDIVVPIDLRNIGYWLKAIFGDYSVVKTESYMHTFKSGASFIPSLSLEIGLPNVPEYILFSGVRANSIALDFGRSGEAKATINLIGQSESSNESSSDTNPNKVIYTRFSQFQGAIKQRGKALADVTGASLTYSNNLEKIETIRDDGKLDGIDLGIASLTGSISVRYGDSSLMDIARMGEAIDIELSYTIDEKNKLKFTAHQVYLPKPKRSITGPGGVEVSYDFQGAKHEGLGNMLDVILINDVEDYDVKTNNSKGSLFG